MRRKLIILGVLVLVSLIHTSEVRSGGMAGDIYTSFTGPAFSATVVVNPDKANSPPGDCPGGTACPYQGTVAITLSKGNIRSAAIFISGAGEVVDLLLGCDVALTDARFLGLYGWIPDPVLVQLLAPFGVALDPLHPLVLSDIDNPVCTPVPNQIATGAYNVLSFTGTMQFGVTKRK